MIEFLWTTTDEWESRLIKWGLDEDCSHFAIRFGDVIFQSYEGRVREDTWWDFQKGKTVIHSARPKMINQAEVIAMHKKLRETIGDKGYDFLAILYWGWRGVLKKFFGIPIPKTNRWGTGKKYYCVEILDPIRKELEKCCDINFEGMDMEMISPHMLFDIVSKSKNIRIIRR